MFEFQFSGDGTASINPTSGTTVAQMSAAEWGAITNAWQQQMHILEAFNGRYFFELPTETQLSLSAVSGVLFTEGTIATNNNNTGGGTGIGTSGSGGSVGLPSPPTVALSFSIPQKDLLDQSYAELKNSVYNALLIQTRFKPILDQLDLIFDDTGVRLDFTAIEQHFQTGISNNAVNGIIELLEFNKATENLLSGGGWKGYQILENTLRSQTITPELQAVFDEFHISRFDQTNFSTITSAKNDIILAGDTADFIVGNAGNDIIFAGGGNDNLQGDDGQDRLDGGLGNDYLQGGNGADIYVFGKGAGQDIILNYDTDFVGEKLDRIEFAANVLPSEISLSRSGDDLIVRINNTTDQLTVQSYFYQDAASAYGLDLLQFADGTVWDVEQTQMAA